MANVVSFIGITPAARYDGDTWTGAEIQEAALRNGIFATIDTIDFSGSLDADATSPKPRNMTTALTTLPTGWYRVVFTDAAGNQSVHAPQQFGAETPDFLPSVSDVGAKLTARTKDPLGNELGTFTSATRPTAAQVTTLIEQSAQIVVAKVGDVIPDNALPIARSVIALRAAMAIELTFFPEQIQSQKSAYTDMRDMFKEELGALALAVTEMASDDGTGGEAGDPEWSFPGASGWDTRRW